MTAGAVTFGGGQSYTLSPGLSGGTLALNNGTSAATITVNAGAPLQTISAPVVLASNLTVTNSGSNSLTLSGGLTGGSNRLVLASGNLTLSGASAFSVGSLTLTSGTLAGAGAAVLTVTGNADLQVGTVSVNLAGGMNLTKSATGIVVLSGSNGYSGSTTVSGGTLQLGNTAALPSATVLTLSTGGTLDLYSNSQTVGGFSGAGGTVTNSGTDTPVLTVNQAGNTTFYGRLAGALGLTKSGSGRLTLNNTSGSANSYSGATTLNAGTLQLGGSFDTNIGSSLVTVNAGGTFDLSSQTYSGHAITLAGGTVSGSNTWTLDADPTWTGGLITGGTLALGGNRQFTINTGTVTINDAITGANTLTKAGGGTLVLGSSSNAFSATAINAGTLQVGANAAIPTGSAVTINRATLNLQNFTETFGAMTLTSGTISGSGSYNLTMTANPTLSGNVSISGGTLNLNGAVRNFTTSDSISIADTVTNGTLTKAGTGTMTLASGASVGTTAVQVTGGSLVNGAGNQFATTTNVKVETGGTWNLGGFDQTINQLAYVTGTGGTVNFGGSGTLIVGAGNVAESYTFNGKITGSGSLTKTGQSTLILSGSNGYSGSTTLSGGTLQLGSTHGPAFRHQPDPERRHAEPGGLQQHGQHPDPDGRLDRQQHRTYSPSPTRLSSSPGTISASLSGGTLTKNTSGTVTLTGSSNFSGPVAINDNGILNVRNAAALGVATNTVTVSSGAALQVQSGISLGNPLTLNGTGSAGAGALQVNDTNTNVISGNMNLATDSSIGAITGGTLNVTGSIGGSGNLTKVGAGILQLSNAHNNYGNTTISAGTLKLGTTGAVPSASTLTLSAGTLDLNGNSLVLASLSANAGTITSSTGTPTLTLGSGTIGIALTGTLALTMTGSGTLQLKMQPTVTAAPRPSAAARCKWAPTRRFPPATP